MPQKPVGLPKKETIDTPVGPAERTTSEIGHEPQRFSELSASEIKWINEKQRAAEAIVQNYAKNREIAQLDPGSLDEAFAAWLEQPEGSKEAANDVLNALGIAFGQYLVDTLDMKWVVVTDSQGTDLAVRAEPGDVLAFPTSSVAKRFQKRERGFFGVLYYAIKARVDEEQNPAAGG